MKIDLDFLALVTITAIFGGLGIVIGAFVHEAFFSQAAIIIGMFVFLVVRDIRTKLL